MGIGEGIAQAIITMIVLAFMAGAFVMWLVPIIAEWVSPLLHALTA